MTHSPIISDADRAILADLDQRVRVAYGRQCRPLPGEDHGDLVTAYAEVRLARARATFAAFDRIGRANDYHRQQIAEFERAVADATERATVYRRFAA